MSFSFGLGATANRGPTARPLPTARKVVTPIMQADKDSDEEMEEEVTEMSVFDDSRHEKKETFIVIPLVLTNTEDAEKKPLLMRNRLKGLEDLEDDQERYRFDVTQRPDQTHTDYNKVPCSEFGEAYLRGLGWKPGTPVGKSNAQVVPIITLQSRAHRLGLGAKSQAPPEIAEMKKKEKAKLKAEEAKAKKRDKEQDKKRQT